MEREQAEREHDGADDDADHIRKPGQENGHQRREEQPQAKEGDIAERPQPEAGIDADCVGTEARAAQPVEAERQRPVRPEEGPERDAEYEPRRSAQERLQRPVADERGDGEDHRSRSCRDEGPATLFISRNGVLDASSSSTVAVVARSASTRSAMRRAPQSVIRIARLTAA